MRRIAAEKLERGTLFVLRAMVQRYNSDLPAASHTLMKGLALKIRTLFLKNSRVPKKLRNYQALLHVSPRICAQLTEISILLLHAFYSLRRQN